MNPRAYSSKLSAFITALTLTASQYGLTAEPAVMPMDHSAHGAHGEVVEGVGVVKSIDAGADTVTLEHEPIPALNWPAMTMPFKVAGNAEETLEVGTKVKFELSGTGAAATITKIDKAD